MELVEWPCRLLQPTLARSEVYIIFYDKKKVVHIDPLSNDDPAKLPTIWSQNHNTLLGNPFFHLFSTCSLSQCLSHFFHHHSSSFVKTGNHNPSPLHGQHQIIHSSFMWRGVTKWAGGTSSNFFLRITSMDTEGPGKSYVDTFAVKCGWKTKPA